MQNMPECEIESTTKLSLKDFECICLGAWERLVLQSGWEYTGTDPLEHSLCCLILEEASKLGIDLSTSGILSLEDKTEMIRHMYFRPEMEEELQFMAQFLAKRESEMSGSEPMETSQQPSSSHQNPSPSPQTNSERWPLREGVKYDGDKERFDLLPPEALFEVCRVFTNGAAKYSDRNWELGIKYGRVFGAVQRHLWKWQSGQDIDPEWGLNHLAHACAGILFLLHYSSRPAEFRDKWDDRPCHTQQLPLFDTN